MEKDNKLLIYIGLPGSGKSTVARQWVREDPEHRVRVNYDDLREMFGEYSVLSRETLVHDCGYAIIQNAMDKEFDIVCDNTNLNPKRLKELYAIALRHGYAVEYQFFDVSAEECIKRDKSRKRPVGEKVIMTSYEKYKDIVYIDHLMNKFKLRKNDTEGN